MTKKKTKRPTFRRRNISQELHDAWKQQKRTGDEKLIAEEVGVSEYTIRNAISYGFVHTEELVKAITAFYAARYKTEQELAQQITN